MGSDLSPEQRRWRTRIFIVTWVAYAGFYLCRKNFSVCMPFLQEDLGFSKNDLAVLISLHSLMYALGQFCNGVLSDRFGPRIIVSIGHVIALATSFVMGFGQVYALFFAMYVLNGVGQSTGWSGTVKNMATWFRHRERGIVMGFWCTCYVIGGFVATNFATFAATNKWLFPAWGWRRGFWAPALLLGVVALVYAALTRNKPSDVGLPDFPEDDATIEEIEEEDESPEEAFWDIFRRVFSKKVVWITGSTYFLVKLTRYVFIFWLPLYMVEALSYEKAAAGYASSVYELVGFTGVILAGFLSDKVFQSRRFPIAAIMLYGLAVACLFHPHFAAMGMFWNCASIGLIGMLTFGPDAIMSGPAAQDLGSQRGAAMATGIINGLGSFGQIISPLLVAVVSGSRFGWDGVFYVFVALALISATSMATLWRYTGDRPETADV